MAAVPNMPPPDKVYEIEELNMKVIDIGARILGFVPFGLKNLDNQMIIMIESP